MAPFQRPILSQEGLLTRGPAQLFPITSGEVGRMRGAGDSVLPLPLPIHLARLRTGPQWAVFPSHPHLIQGSARMSVAPNKGVMLFGTTWTLVCQAPLSMEFSRHEYWSGLPFPSPGNLPYPGIKPRSPALQADSLSSEPLKKYCLTT